LWEGLFSGRFGETTVDKFSKKRRRREKINTETYQRWKNLESLLYEALPRFFHLL
jgi:hypothetical protein